MINDGDGLVTGTFLMSVLVMVKLPVFRIILYGFDR
jgi:hypothetical protein